MKGQQHPLSKTNRHEKETNQCYEKHCKQTQQKCNGFDALVNKSVILS